MKKFILLFLTCIMVMSGTVMSFAEEGGEARLSVSVANDGKITFSCTGDIQEDYYVGVGGGERNGWVDGIAMSWSAWAGTARFCMLPVLLQIRISPFLVSTSARWALWPSWNAVIFPC